MSKQVTFDFDARTKLASGVKKLSDAVASTMGPAGRNVVIEKAYSSPLVVNDGVTVAKNIELPDKFENMGAKLVIEVASKTNTEAGDGTTTATVIANAIVQEGIKLLSHGVSPMAVKRGIDKAMSIATGKIASLSIAVKDIGDLEKVATISANGDSEIGALVAKAVDHVGNDGVVTMEDGKGTSSELVFRDGYHFNKGYLSPYFITDNKRMCVTYNDAKVLVYDGNINDVREILPVLEQTLKANAPLLVIANDLGNEVLSALVVNKLRTGLPVVAVKSPEFGQNRSRFLQDIATISGTIVIDPSVGTKLSEVSLANLGSAKSITVDKDSTLILDGAGKPEDVKAHIEMLKAQLGQPITEFDKEKLEERIAKVSGSIAVIRVGGFTESEVSERKYRVEDAIHATMAAYQEGIVPGGGVSYVRAAEAVRAGKYEADEEIGARILAAALEAPARTIASNAGASGDATVERIKGHETSSYGYNARTGKFGDLLEDGVVDPTKVARSAIQNATSVAGLILTTNTLVADLPEDSE